MFHANRAPYCQSGLATNRIFIEAEHIKHSLSTALRQLVSILETQRLPFRSKLPPPKDKLPCGLLGAGQFFNYAYVPALNQSDLPLAITGVQARSEEKFQIAQSRLRYQADFFPDAESLFTSGIRAALILLPNDLHFSTTQAALKHGLHVFCEKPLTPSVAKAMAAHIVAETAGRVLMVDFNERFFDRNRVLKKLLEDNCIGRVTAVHAFHNQDLRGLKDFSPLHRDRTGGGVLLNAGIHFINLFLHWFGEVETVKAVFENRALPAECGEDTAHCELIFRSGVRATLEASLANAVDASYERVHFAGETGELFSDFKKCNILWRPRGRRQTRIPCRAEIVSDSVRNALDHFARCVQNHLRPETDERDFIQTMKTVEALTQSARRGEAVTLAEIEAQYA